VPHRFDKNLGDVSTRNAVADSQRQIALAYNDRVFSSGAIEEKTDAKDRVVQTAGPDLVLDAPTSNKRVPLEPVNQ
jgi:hypothetical protein